MAANFGLCAFWTSMVIWDYITDISPFAPIGVGMAAYYAAKIVGF
jgi:hypothetical protein